MHNYIYKLWAANKVYYLLFTINTLTCCCLVAYYTFFISFIHNKFICFVGIVFLVIKRAVANDNLGWLVVLDLTAL